MATLLGSRNFATGSGGGGSAIARAKKVADLYIRNNTNEAGDVTDPNVYSYVINNILAPYADDIGIQQKVATYKNKVKDLKTKEFDQDNTLGVFKQNVSEALYSRGNVIRDPAQMALFSASALDNVVNTLDVAIKHAQDTGKAADKLIAYRKEVNETAGGQRDLVNALNSGSNPQVLDGYGYFVKTNPVDGSLVGAALLPVNSAPSEIKQNMKRIDNTVGINNSKLPVYLPVTKDADGQLTAKLYGNTWSGGDSDPVLSGNDTPNFQDKNAFDIRDQSMFPIKKNDISPGGFGRVVRGVKDNQTQFGYYYKGADGKVRELDQAGIDAFKQDPIFANKVNGYIPLLAPDEVSALGNIDRLNPSDVPKWGADARIQDEVAKNQQARQAVQDIEKTPFARVENAANAVGNTLGGALNSAVSAVSGFFSNRKNQPNKPEQAAQGDKTSYSAADVVDKGKSIFSGGGGGNVA